MRSAWALLGLLACAGPVPAGPKPHGVAPSKVAADAPASLTITGQDFFAEVLTDFGRPGKSVLSGAFGVRLQPESGEGLLLGAALIDAGTLWAELPGLSGRGLYDVVVIDAAGREGTLAGGLRVVTSAESVAGFAFDFVGAQRAGVPFAVGLTAVDEVGAPVDGYDGTATVRGPVAPVSLGPFARGRARGYVTVPMPAVGVVLTAADALGHQGFSEPFVVTSGEPAAVAFVEAPPRVAAGACGGPFTLEVQDTLGNPAPAAAAAAYTVSVSPPEGGAPFADAACATAASGGELQGRASFFVRSTLAGRSQLRVVPSAWPSATREVDVDAGPAVAVGIASAPQVLAVGACSQPVVVQAVDAFGNASPVAAAVALELALEPPAGVTLHGDPACATGLPAPGLAAGASEARFHFRSAVAGLLRLSVDAGSLGAVEQREEVTP